MIRSTPGTVGWRLSRATGRWSRVATPVFFGLVLLGAGCSHEPTGPGNGKVRELWFAPQAFGYPDPRPVISSDKVFFAAGGGAVIARDVATGSALWTSSAIGPSQYSGSSEIMGGNFVLKGGVLITAVQFHTSGIDPETGREIWRYHAPLDTIYDRAAARPGFVVGVTIDADENTVFIPAWGASVSAVNIQTGVARWIWRVDPTIQFRSGAEGVQVSGDTVFATIWHFLNPSGTRSEGWLVALDKQTGRELWRAVLPKESSGVMVNPPAVWRNLVIVTIDDGETYAIDRNTHQIVWQVPQHIPAVGLGTALITGAQVYGDMVYASGSDRMMRAYNAADGHEIWESDAGQNDRPILVTDKFVYAQNGASLYILDRLTGAQYASLGHPRKSSNYAYTSGAAFDSGRIFITFTGAAWSFAEP